MWSAPPSRACGPSRASGLFAQFNLDLELVILALLLVGLIIGGVILVKRVRLWRMEQAAPTLDEQLQSFQALVDKGELDAQEFERIRAQLEDGGAPPSTPS